MLRFSETKQFVKSQPPLKLQHWGSSFVTQIQMFYYAIPFQLLPHFSNPFTASSLKSLSKFFDLASYPPFSLTLSPNKLLNLSFPWYFFSQDHQWLHMAKSNGNSWSAEFDTVVSLASWMPCALGSYLTDCSCSILLTGSSS